MKREIDIGQDLNLCLPMTQPEVGVRVLFFYGNGKGNGDVGEIVYVSPKGKFVMQWQDDTDVTIYYPLGAEQALRVAPLCWVEGKPVYPGDLLHRKDGAGSMMATRYTYEEELGHSYLFGTDLELGGEGVPEEDSGMYPEQMTWTKPVKMVKKSGWMNIYGDVRTPGVHFTLDAANNNAARGRKACIPVFWEEEE